MPGTELLAPLGCGVTTGAGVLNAFEVGAGSSIAVFGTGAVGMAAVMAGRAAGAATIIGVDVVPSRLLLAAELTALSRSRARRGYHDAKPVSHGAPRTCLRRRPPPRGPASLGGGP